MSQTEYNFYKIFTNILVLLITKGQRSTTAVDPQHLKVKDTQHDISVNKKLLHHYHNAKNQLNL